MFLDKTTRAYHIVATKGYIEASTKVSIYRQLMISSSYFYEIIKKIQNKEGMFANLHYQEIGDDIYNKKYIIIHKENPRYRELKLGVSKHIVPDYENDCLKEIEI